MTTTEQLIFKAARGYTSGPMTLKARNKAIAHFTAGASFATTDPEMMKAMLQPFAEWMNSKDLVPLVKGGWMHHYEPYEKFANNSEELISKYIQFITDKP